jgi:hypothetical protein
MLMERRHLKRRVDDRAFDPHREMLLIIRGADYQLFHRPFGLLSHCMLDIFRSFGSNAKALACVHGSDLLGLTLSRR